MNRFRLAIGLCVLVFVSKNCFSATPILTKEGAAFLSEDESIMETTPVIWQGDSVLFGSIRRGGSSHTPDQLALVVRNMKTGENIAEFGSGHSLGCAFIETKTDGDVFHVFAAEQPAGETWFRDIDHFSSRDLKTWKKSTALKNESEHLLNSSVCRDQSGYMMAYESDRPVGFCFKFARSNDLESWEKIPDVFYAGPDGKTYSACPVIRWFAPYYYVIYLRADGRGGYESALIRSKNLRQWEDSPLNPILKAGQNEGINNSDVDLFEEGGKTWLVYATGDQQTWCDIRRASFDGTMREFFESCYPPTVSSEEKNKPVQ